MSEFVPDDTLHAWLLAAYRGGGPSVKRLETVFTKQGVTLPAGIITVLPAKGVTVDLHRLEYPHIALAHHEGLIALVASNRHIAGISQMVSGQDVQVTKILTFAEVSEAVVSLNHSIILSRKLELAPLFERLGSSAHFDLELHLRARALHALRHSAADWPERLRDWSDAMLVRHYPRLNGIRRKYIEFLSLLVHDFDFGWGSDWAFIRAVRMTQECYRMTWLTDHFSTIVKELLPFISGRASDIMITTETQEDFNGTVRKAIEFIREHYLEPIGLAEVAAGLGVSGPYLSRTFHREAQVTLTEYLQKIRIEHAREMLSTTDNSVIAISLSCGFQSSKHFHRTFRKHTGLTPTAFRESRRF